jgi:hypothetical protein
MSTNPAERLRGGIAALLTLVLVSGCGLIQHDDPPLRVVPTDVAAEPQHVLEARGRALRQGNESAFLATINRADRTLRWRERRYFTNIGQLPVGQVSYELDPASMIDTGEGVTAVVRRHLQLTPYDARPVITPDRMRFAVVDGRYVIANDQDHDWQEANGIAVPPWDATRVQVRSVAGVLGVFDDRSVADSDSVLADVQRGLDDVSALVPEDWSREVVVYALSDTSAFPDDGELPGGDPDHLDGVAIPVQASPRSDVLAATRFALHPRMLAQPGVTRQRLIRHELTHVAVGMLDDHVPVWLSEGLAEWVSVQPIPVSERVISAAALDEARSGFTAMPGDDGFNGPHSGANYGLSWWACDWIATTYGPSMLWTLLDTMAAGDGTSEADQDAVLRQLLGIDSHELARHAADRIVATFG